MKKILQYGLISFLMMISFLNIEVEASSNEVFEVMTSKVTSASVNDEVHEVRDGYLFTNNNGINYYYNNIKILELNEDYLCHVTDEDYLYLISKDFEKVNIRKINKTNKKVQKDTLEIDNPQSIKRINEELIIVGSKSSDAIISRYDLNLTYLHSYQYGGKGYEGFKEIYSDGNDYFLLGIKDAHSGNSPFSNVGNANEQKVFLTKINEQGIIIDTVYFNHQEEKEEILDSHFQKQMLVVKIKAGISNYLYYLNTDLHTIKYLEKTAEEKSLGIISNSNDYLTIKEAEGLVLEVDEKRYDLSVDGSLKKVTMEDNVLCLYYYCDYYLWKAQVFQYAITKQEDIIINNLQLDFNEKMNMNNLKEIQIKSFIHLIDLQLSKIEPYFNKQINGEYLATFKVVINNNQGYYFTNKIIIENYVNIIDNHTYPVGYQINFLGYGFLDEKSIVSGYQVSEEGVHNLVITDASGNKNKYSFRVVNSDYYKPNTNEVEYMEPDYIINKNQELKLKLITNKEVKEVYINEQLTNFENVEEGVEIKVSSFNKAGMHALKINRIVYVDETYEVDKTILVRVLKEAPKIDIMEDKSDNLTLNMHILDLDHSLENIKFIVYHKEEKVGEYFVDFMGGSINDIGNIPKDKEFQIKGFLQYDEGEGVINEVEFLDFVVNLEDLNNQLITWEVLDNYQSINIRIHTDDANLVINKLKVGDKEIGSKYQVVNNYKPLYISLILSGIVLVSAGIYFIYKRKKLKK